MLSLWKIRPRRWTRESFVAEEKINTRNARESIRTVLETFYVYVAFLLQLVYLQ